GLVALMCTGCLDLDKETAVAVFRLDKDEVRVLFVYEGLHVSGTGVPDLDNARKALSAVFAESNAFYLGHPLFAIDLGLPKEGKESDHDRKSREFAKKHIDVQKGIFFLGKDGQFGGAQTILIHEASKFVDGLNSLVSEVMADELAKPEKKYDAATLDLLKKAVTQKHTWFQLEPGRISFTFPGSPQYLASAKREFLEGLGVKTLREIVDPPLPPKGNTIVLGPKKNLDNLPIKEQLAA